MGFATGLDVGPAWASPYGLYMGLHGFQARLGPYMPTFEEYIFLIFIFSRLSIINI